MLHILTDVSLLLYPVNKTVAYFPASLPHTPNETQINLSVKVNSGGSHFGRLALEMFYNTTNVICCRVINVPCRISKSCCFRFNWKC